MCETKPGTANGAHSSVLMHAANGSHQALSKLLVIQLQAKPHAAVLLDIPIMEGEPSHMGRKCGDGTTEKVFHEVSGAALQCNITDWLVRKSQQVQSEL